MRFTLRNQHKIKAAFSEAFLDELLEDLKIYFKTNSNIEQYEVGYKFKMIQVPRKKIRGEFHHLFIYDSKYDVLNLAYKETIKK